MKILPPFVLALFAGAVATAQQPAPATPPTVPSATPPAPSPVVPSDPAPPTVATPVEPAAPATHTVAAGDNPWTIAKKHGVALDDLLKLNKIKDPKSLKVGDVLTLPAPAAAASQSPAAAGPAAAPAPEEPPAGADWEWYTVAKGDNPWKIAKARKVPHGKIVSLNQGVDFTRLDIGQRIKVPKGE